MKRMEDEKIIANVIMAMGCFGFDQNFCGLDAVALVIEHHKTLTDVAKNVLGLNFVESWGFMAGWDDMKWDTNNALRHYEKDDQEAFSRGYALGQASYLACKE